MRTRNLDHSKPMVIYDATKDDLPDRMDHQGVVRTTNILPTGIEKEEETVRSPLVLGFFEPRWQLLIGRFVL
jgi:hypothetical protein